MKINHATYAAIAAIVAASAPAQAETAADFYKGKTVTMVVAYSAGGMYGLNARIMSRYFGKHVPGNPTVVVQHMSGAGGSKAANYMYTAAPKDGSYVAELSKDVAVAQVLRPKQVKYKADEFGYLGRMNSYSAAMVVWHTAGVRTLEDAKTKQVIVANSGKAAHDYMESSLLRHYAGLKLKLVTGYRGAAGMYKAMESGEVHARLGAWVGIKAQKGDWLRDKKAFVIVQTGLKKASDMPDVPLMIDLMPNDEARKMAEVMSLGGPVGWGLQTPPGAPKDRVAVLTKAFADMVKDPDFLAEAKKRNAPVDPESGAYVTKMIKRTFDISPELVKKMQAIAGFKG
jgi:tripartite-type tricarboxylate transporter receptor subunit TctC